jgi:hypothetical protein
MVCLPRLRGQQVLQALKALKEFKVFRAYRVMSAQLVHKGFKVMLAQQGLLALQETKVLLAPLERKVIQSLDLQAQQVMLAQMVTVI